MKTDQTAERQSGVSPGSRELRAFATAGAVSLVIVLVSGCASDRAEANSGTLKDNTDYRELRYPDHL